MTDLTENLGTISTYYPTGTGGVIPTNVTTGPPAEYTGAGSVVKVSGMSVIGLVVFGVASLIVV